MSIKSKFINQILNEEGKRMLSNQGRAIRKAVKFRSGRLEKDRNSHVVGSSLDSNKLEVTVPHYHRLLDIKRVVKNKRGKSTSRKSRKIYNRFVMGSFNTIGFRIANDFSEEVKRDIRLKFKGGLRNG